MELIVQEGLQGGNLGTGSAAGTVTGLAALVDEFAHATLVTSADGRIVHANQAGRHELARARVLMQQGGSLQAARADCDTELHLAIGRAADGRRCLLQLHATEGPSTSVAILPLKTAPGEPARVALVMARMAVCDPLMMCFFARRHNLTPTEQQVLALLCEGLSAPQVAKQLKVAVSTVRSHVRSVCAKTRTRGVRELVTRLAVLPAVAAAFPHEAVH